MLQHILKPPLAPSLRWTHLLISAGTVFAAQLGILTGIFECAAVALLVVLLIQQGNARPPDGGPPITFSHISSQVFGVFYTGYLPAFWVRLRSIALPLPSTPTPFLVSLLNVLHWPLTPDVGSCATTTCALCVIAADTCAYVGGRKFGKTPLILISPNKTVEGACCGLAGSVAMALLCNCAWGSPSHTTFSVLFGFVMFWASLLGDLTVSAMKRDAGLKDAGTLIPGHGGVLDRFDSYFFSAPAAYFLWYMYLRVSGSPLRCLVAQGGPV